MNFLRKIKVLVVDDSAVMRKMISDVLGRDPQIEVVGSAVDPYMSRDKIQELNPDVLTLDIEMPRMDGITFLKVLQQHRPMPVIVISSLTQAGSDRAVEALEAGAIDVLCKPTSAGSITHFGEQLVKSVKAAAGSLRRPASAIAPASAPVGVARHGGYHPKQLILLGASIGGTEALKEVLMRLPRGLPPIAIAQHIPTRFSRAFAEQLDELCAFEVREAADGDELCAGVALVAPGGFHMTVKWSAQGYQVALDQSPPVHHCRPAVDVLFRSASQCPGARIVAGILTGMGRDGALGMRLLKDMGARTFAQDEATCAVYGMPKAAVELGGVDQELPLLRIAPAILEAANSMAPAAEAPAIQRHAAISRVVS